MGPAFWRGALAQAAPMPGTAPYGPLGPADLNGLMLPQGFTSRVVAQGQTPASPSGYPWHVFSDGASTYPTPDGGWILVSNCEAPSQSGGGASAMRFAKDGAIQDAYRILGGTENNCAGGLTPYGTWLSCEETDRGRVWECDPAGKHPAVVRDAMGVFKHEAACVDQVGRRAYLTEDASESGLYRFTPPRYPFFGAGTLEIATGAVPGPIVWEPVPDPLFTGPTRTFKQVPGAIRFRRGEGIWFDSGFVYVATTSDDRVYAYDTSLERIEVIYDGKALGDVAPLHQVDNITVHPASGDLFAGEDNDNLELCVLTPDRQIAPFARLSGAQHQAVTVIPGLPDSPADSGTSEVTGPTFNPDGTRLYFSSQRAFGVGAIYEVTGPFRRVRTPPARQVVNPATGVRPPRDGDVLPEPPLGGLDPTGLGVRPLRLRAKPRSALAAVRTRGLIATLEVDSPGTYEIALVANFTPARARRSEQPRGKRRTIVLARGRRTASRPGVLRVRLKLGPAALRALRNRPETLRATLRARQTAGSRRGRRATLPLKLTVPRRRRRRRRAGR